MQAFDFVYCGVRVDNAGKKFIEVRPIAEDGTLMKARQFDYSRKHAHVCGQVYTGAQFSDTSALGLNVAKWKGEYKGPDADALRFHWAALESACEQELARLSLEKNASKRDAIERALLPLRRAWSDMHDRGDIPGCIALERAVGAALRRKVASDEKTRFS